MSENNLNLWKKVSKTDPKNTKQVGFGRKFTAIDAMSQIQAATEQFGPFGLGWGVQDERFFINTIKDTFLLTYQANLFFRIGEDIGIVPLHSSLNMIGKKGVDDESYKKIATDALTKGLSKLGFNADIFLGLFDDNRYVNEMKKEFKDEKKLKANKKEDTAKVICEEPSMMPEEDKRKLALKNVKDGGKMLGWKKALDFQQFLVDNVALFKTNKPEEIDIKTIGIESLREMYTKMQELLKKEN